MQLVLAALLLALDVAASWLPTAPALRPRHDTRAHRAASATRRAASITAAAAGGARLVYCDGLSKSYDGQRFQFRDISLGVATGQRVGLIGVNGVGKSTLMKCLAGIEQHDAGRSALSLCLCPGLRLSLRLSSRPHAFASAQAFASASASASTSASTSASASASAVTFALTFSRAPLAASASRGGRTCCTWSRSPRAARTWKAARSGPSPTRSPSLWPRERAPPRLARPRRRRRCGR